MVKNRLIISLFAVLSIVASVVFVVFFLGKSDWSWVAQQGVVLQSTVLTILFSVVFSLVLFLTRAYKGIRIGFVTAVFLLIAFVYSFFWAVLGVILYAAMLYLTGHFCVHLFLRSKTEREYDLHFYLVFGICGILCVVGIASLLRIGTADKLRIILPLLFVVELILDRRFVSGKASRLYEKYLRGKESAPCSATETICLGILLGIIAMFIARANIAIDFDSLWYGLRSDYVLAPETGIYDPTILMCVVYNYPKGFETLSLVFSGLSTNSFISGLNILFATLTVHCAYRMGLLTLPRNKAIKLSMLIVLTPAIMVLSTTSKSDLSTLYLQVVALYFTVRCLSRKSVPYFVASIGTLILTLGFKSSSVVFSTFLALIILFMAVKYHFFSFRRSVRFLVPPVLATAFITARTVLLTGYPFNTLIVSFLKNLGYYPKYPYTLPSSRVSSIGELFTTDLFWKRFLRLFKLFFFPNTSDIYTLEMTWWGPLFSLIWFFAVIFFLFHAGQIAKQWKKDPVSLFSFALFLVISLVSGGCMMLLETPDGNYFMLFFVATYWFVMTELQTVQMRHETVLQVVFVPVLLCNIFLSVLISPSWTMGFTPIELQNLGYYNYEEKVIRREMEQKGLTEVYDYYKTFSLPQRVISFDNDCEANIFSMPAVIESYSHQKLWGANTCGTPQELYEFMQYAKVDSLLIDDTLAEVDPKAVPLLQQLAQEGVLHMEKRVDGYAILHVSGKDSVPDEQVISYLETIQ